MGGGDGGVYLEAWWGMVSKSPATQGEENAWVLPWVN